jgi:hypothetical protein
MIRKVAISAKTWGGILNSTDGGKEEDVLRFLIELREKGVETVIVALGDEDAAEQLDPVFIKPKKIPAFYMNPESIQAFEEETHLNGKEEVKWSTCCYLANKSIEHARDWYMEDVGITKKSPTDSNNEMHNVMVQWSLKKWKPPRFKFMEATTRKQLGELKKLSEGKGYGGSRQ